MHKLHMAVFFRFLPDLYHFEKNSSITVKQTLYPGQRPIFIVQLKRTLTAKPRNQSSRGTVSDLIFMLSGLSQTHRAVSGFHLARCQLKGERVW